MMFLLTMKHAECQLPRGELRTILRSSSRYDTTDAGDSNFGVANFKLHPWVLVGNQIARSEMIWICAL